MWKLKNKSTSLPDRVPSLLARTVSWSIYNVQCTTVVTNNYINKIIFCHSKLDIVILNADYTTCCCINCFQWHHYPFMDIVYTCKSMQAFLHVFIKHVHTYISQKHSSFCYSTVCSLDGLTLLSFVVGNDVQNIINFNQLKLE